MLDNFSCKTPVLFCFFLQRSFFLFFLLLGCGLVVDCHKEGEEGGQGFAQQLVFYEDSSRVLLLIVIDFCILNVGVLWGYFPRTRC